MLLNSSVFLLRLIILLYFHYISLVCLLSFFLSFFLILSSSYLLTAAVEGPLQHLIILSDNLGMRPRDEGRLIPETINHKQKVQTSMNPAGFEPEISESEDTRSMPYNTQLLRPASCIPFIHFTFI